MLYYKVTNRTTRKTQLLNKDEVLKFFNKNNIREYAVYNALSPKQQQIQEFINTLAISFFSVAFVILASNLIFKFIK